MEMISDKNNNLDKLYYNDFLCEKRRTKMKEPETGKKENTGKSGYSITTWRLHLWCRHPEWLRTTQEVYNRIAEFYYNLLLDHTELWELGSQQTLREADAYHQIPSPGKRFRCIFEEQQPMKELLQPKAISAVLPRMRRSAEPRN